MKFRTDFVTNSSSSSFIIAPHNNMMSKNDVFVKIKEFYKDWIIKKNKMIEFCRNHEAFNVTEDEEGVHLNRVIDDFSVYMKLDDYIEETFDISLFEDINIHLDWMKCETYDEYVAFTSKHKYIDKQEKPFIIIDATNKEEANDFGHILNWYFPCFEDTHFTTKWCEYCSDEKKEYCKLMKTGKSSELNQIILLFGNLCISSESGYIPRSISYDIEELCSKYCHHMG